MENLLACSLFVAMFVLLHVRRFNPLNAELNLIRHLLALVGAHHILHFSRVRSKRQQLPPKGGKPTVSYGCKAPDKHQVIQKLLSCFCFISNL